MFNAKHYVPILKWKAAEKQALENLSEEEKKFVTPLIQLVMPKAKNPKKGEEPKSAEAQLEESMQILRSMMPNQISEGILSSWGNTPAFFDVSLIDISLREEALTTILRAGKKSGASLIPVVGLSSNIKIQTKTALLAKENNSGLCLRLFRSDFSSQSALVASINKLLAMHGLSEKDIDLLVDFQITDEKCSRLVDLSKEIPNILKWRTFTFASGAFPVDLSDCELGVNIIARLDWKHWAKQMNSKELPRKPSFADYTIQHPIHKEAVQFFSPSASIRYTLNDSWLIMRGQKGKFVQYLANAQLLSQHPNYFGPNFSHGDAYIAEKGKDLKGRPGNATTWLVAGINHHLACTVDQLANLS